MLNDIKDLYRYNIYMNCRVLVNDMTEVIEELKLFLTKKIYPYLKEENNIDRFVIDNIEIAYEQDKIVWRIVEKNELNNVRTQRLDLYNIVDLFEDKVEYLLEVKTIYENYPKELYGLSLISFIQTLSNFIFSDELIDDTNIFDICVISNNGVNNIVYMEVE